MKARPCVCVCVCVGVCRILRAFIKNENIPSSASAAFLSFDTCSPRQTSLNSK